MKKEIIIPKGTPYMVFLDQVGKQMRNSWIFIHDNVTEFLKNSPNVDFRSTYEMDGYIFSWPDPKTSLEVSYESIFSHSNYTIITSIDSDNNFSFSDIASDPEDVIFFKMEE